MTKGREEDWEKSRKKSQRALKKRGSNYACHRVYQEAHPCAKADVEPVDTPQLVHGHSQ